MMRSFCEATSLGRRRFLLGLTATSFVAACAEQSTEIVATRALSAMEDPLAGLRFQADADVDIWARHLDLSRLTAKPQMLALSGGGEDGAFGAGALCGWSQTGQRPDFDIVTGVSTGALIAPMAFLGADRDEALQHMFLDHDADDIMRFRGLAAVSSDGIYDTAPLADLIATYTPTPVMEAITRKHEAGGRMFVVTANLATSRAIVWDMGEIAKAGFYDLFRSVIRASGALPGLFSPVKIHFDHEGETMVETHVDGGIQMQFLATPPAAFEVSSNAAQGGAAYLLINNTLDPEPQKSAETALGISQQAMTAMVRSSAASSVNTARLLAHDHGLGFRVTSVSADSGIHYDPSDRFSSRYMAAMFAHGYDRAVSGALWAP
ncbi:patatin-like phospholipase [Yoonia maricola]|uniref:Patatin-like phospholipase n=1 Tax=Yoonia maricola TaxID=420999 RepID=A0A2M8W5T8_9RHOB|nr:patatin-like phospholipase family protein [Yoonia maricola]PJI86284.1 patatin-like phospholipase [Yoonia maricola]